MRRIVSRDMISMSPSLIKELVPPFDDMNTKMDFKVINVY